MASSSLKHIEQAAKGIVLNINTDKTQFMCFKQGNISYELFYSDLELRIYKAAVIISSNIKCITLTYSKFHFFLYSKINKILFIE